MFAAPVRASTFVALSPEHDQYNVEVDLSAMEAFGGHVAAPENEQLLFSDYRTIMGFYLRRVGAGRSGYYQGAYLKGVGRTPLTFNWSQARDYFASGHLPASGGARELVVSRYFAAKGRSHLINPCRGLLVRNLAPGLRDARRWLNARELPPLDCDRTLQVISVKDPRFARFSNVVWHLNHLSLFKGELDVVRFFTLLLSGLRPYQEVDPAEVVPSAIARALAEAIGHTIASYREFWRLGVSWISVQTDPTMDGRCHDIDLPLFHGPGYLGATAKLEAYRPGTLRIRLPLDVSWSAISGFSVLEYLHAMRLFVRYLKSTLGVYLASEFSFSGPERDFVDGFLAALDEALPRDHLLWSGAECAKMLRRWIDEECEVAEGEQDTIRALVDAAVACRLDASANVSMQLPVEEVPIVGARAGSRSKFSDSFLAIAGAAVRPERLEEARFLNVLIGKLDAITDLDEFCAAAVEAEEQIARDCGA